MATEQQLNQFVINKVENQYVYDYMVENGLVNDDELYIVEGDNKVTEEDLDTSLAEKINNASDAIHSHPNKSVIDSIKQTDIDNWNDANSKKHSHTNKSVLDSIDNTSVINWNDANSKKHEHANKALLDSISQSVMDNWNNAYSQSHTHSNKSLLDTYTQSNANISDAVTKRHTHSNKSALDSITQEKITNWDGANAYTDEKIAELINGAPSTLDTLGEIAEAMKNNENVVSALNDAIGTKANASDLSSHTGNKSNPHNVTKSQIGLGSVENKSSATIRGEITKQNVTEALGYTPPTQDTTYSTGTSTQSGLTKLYSGTGGATDGTMTQKAISDALNNVDVIPEAIIEQNTKALQKVWRGTKAEYDAIPTKDSTCLYIVTDELVSSDFEVKSNKATIINENSTDEQYPSAKAVYDKLANLDSYEQTANKVTTIDLRSTDDTYPSSRAVWRLKLDSNQKYTNLTNSLNNKENLDNKVIAFGDTVTDEQYPSALLVYNIVSQLLKGIIHNGTTLTVDNGIISINTPEIYYSTLEPTETDGKVGDMWVVYEE